ncbi:MAG: hypothetical protein IJ272_09175 [Clostridia bacterium]|nr:hypothetical protein [Clostridia bacterium]
MEDFSIRAIVIGVSLFVTMMTLSAILIYFNTARSIADEVNKRTDIASSYDYIMNSDDFSDELTGVEVRSLINKYAGNKDVRINIVSISGQEVEGYDNVNNKWLKSLNDNASLISEEKLDLVNPVWDCIVNKVENQGRITLNIGLDVED